MKKELSKAFEASTFESGWYDFWQGRGYFTARPDSGRPPFCIVIPPPNVTGKLHMGHALNNTLHDVIVRWKRMKGFDVLWLPGTDHAGIATQMVV
jgi:valyl-tRNA synthetase